jgi:1,4-alpha-glucan branching enzyme
MISARSIYHFDGLGLDAVHAIIDTSAVHFLEQLVCEVTALEAQIGRHLVLIAESDLNVPRIVRPQEIAASVRVNQDGIQLPADSVAIVRIAEVGR